MTRMRKYVISKWPRLAGIMKRAAILVASQKKKIKEWERREREIAEKEKNIDELIRKLTAVVFTRERDIGSYRMMLTFDTSFVDQCLWGGDKWHIENYADYIGERVKWEVCRELKTMNFARYRKVY